MRKLVWTEFSSDSDTPEVSLLISVRTQSILLAALEYVQKEYVWTGSFDDVDAALGNAIEEIIVQVEGGSMSCEDIADCFEEPELITVLQNLITNNTTIINAITQTVTNNGFANTNVINNNYTTILDRFTAADFQSPVSQMEECNLDKLWAGIRHGIVQRLDDAARELMETLVPITDATERFQVFFDTVPVVGDIAEGLAFQLSQAIPDLLNLYDAYSSEATMDEIACDLFAMVCGECRYPSYEEIMDYYGSFGAAGLTDPGSQIMNGVYQALIDSANAVPKVAYHTMIFWELLVLNLDAVFASSTGRESIAQFADIGEDSANNNWLTLCDGCVEPYMTITIDFRTGTHGWYPDTAQPSSTPDPVHVAGKGWLVVPHSTGRRADIATVWNTAWKLRGVAYSTLAESPNAVTGRNVITRPTQGTNTGATAHGASTPSYPWNNCTTGLASITNIKEVALFVQGGATGAIYIEQVRFQFDAGFAMAGSQPSGDLAICT